jgi:chromosome segregation ATPase
MQSALAKEIVSLVDANKELRAECSQQEDEIKIYNKKLNTLNRALDTCYKTISHQDSAIIAHEEVIESLKSEIKSLKLRLHNVLQDLKHKDSACIAQDICILKLEDKIDQLKQRIKDLVNKKFIQNNTSMAVNALFENIGTGLDQLEIYISGGAVDRDRPFNPANALNAIRITITTIRGHCERFTQTAQESARALTTSQNNVNRLNDNIREIRADLERQIQMLTIAYNKERNAHREEWESHRETTEYAGELEDRVTALLAEKFTSY